MKNKKLTNQGYALVWGIASVIAYALPVATIAIIERDRFFKDVGTSLTIVAILAIVCFLVFAKKLVKRLTKVLTPLWFGSLIVLAISLGIRSIANDLLLLSIVSLIASVLAWFPFQIAGVYADRSRDVNGDVIRAKGMPFKEAVGKLFQISLFVKD